MFKPNLRAYAKEALEKRTVEVDDRREGRSRSRRRASRSSPATVIAAHTLVWGAGLQGNQLVAVARARAASAATGSASARTSSSRAIPSVLRRRRRRGDHRREDGAGAAAARLGRAPVGRARRRDHRPPRRGQGDEAVRLPRQGHDGDDRPRRRGRADARRADDEGHEGAGSPGAPCTSRSSRRTRTARRRSSTGRGRFTHQRAGRISVDDGRVDQTAEQSGCGHDRNAGATGERNEARDALRSRPTSSWSSGSPATSRR